MNSNNDSETMFVTQIPKQKRILIIDDEEDVTISLHMVLEQCGFKTDSYTNPVLAHMILEAVNTIY
jgi:FixJ family two-component response regulator